MVTATQTPTQDLTPGGIFVTNTPIPTLTITPSPLPTLTPFPTFTPTTTPQPGSIVFIYNDNVFTLYNSGSSHVDVSGISFEGEATDFVGVFWEEVALGLNISALPSTQCLMIQPEAGSNYVAAPECTQVRSVVEEPNPRYFWLTDFNVLINGEVVTTCDADADRCEITLNGTN